MQRRSHRLFEWTICLIISLPFGTRASAAMKLPAVFAHHMVLPI